MKQEEREQRNYVRSLLSDLKWKNPARMNVAEPKEVKAARQVIARWDTQDRKRKDRLRAQWEKRLAPISEAIAFQKYDLALKLIKKLH